MTEKKKSAKQAFEEKAYKKYLIRLRWDTDRDLIEYIEEEIDRLKAERIARGGGYNVGVSEVIKELIREKI